jgi:hypothetical protein
MMADPLDLCGDNRVRFLLEECERQQAIIRKAEALKPETEAEIREKLGDAAEAFTNDWTIEIKTIRRREYTVPAGQYQTLRCRRLEPAEEELAGEERPIGRQPWPRERRIACMKAVKARQHHWP